MVFLKNFSIFQVFAGAALVLVSIFMTFRIKREIPRDLLRDFKKTTSLIFLFFTGYIFFAFIQLGNVSYPMEPITTSMFLGSACFVYAIVLLTKNFTAKIKEKDLEIGKFIMDQKERGETLEREISGRKRAEDAYLLLEKAAITTSTGITVRGKDGKVRMAEVGEGNLNWSAILKAASDGGVEYVLVEQDQCYERDPFDSLAISLRNLRAMGLS